MSRVSGRTLSKWWTGLADRIQESPDEVRREFCGWEESIASLGLVSLESGPCTHRQEPEAILGIKPGFRRVSLELLAALRRSFHASALPSPEFGMWAESLLRFCEIRSPSLRSAVAERWPLSSESRMGMLQVANLLFDWYAASGDLRFLNTCLKLRDRDFVVSLASTERGLRTATHESTLTLRLLVGTESAMKQMEAEA